MKSLKLIDLIQIPNKLPEPTYFPAVEGRNQCIDELIDLNSSRVITAQEIEDVIYKQENRIRGVTSDYDKQRIDKLSNAILSYLQGLGEK